MKTLLFLSSKFGELNILFGALTILGYFAIFLKKFDTENQRIKYLKRGSVIALFLLAFNVLFIQYVEVPNVVHLEYSNALNKLVENELKYDTTSVDGGINYHSIVVYQEPHAGDFILKNSIVHLNVQPSDNTPPPTTNPTQNPPVAPTGNGSITVPTEFATATPYVTPYITPTPHVDNPVKKISQGTSLVAVNCETFISMRKKPDGNYTSGTKQIKKNEKVSYVTSAENGYYYVKNQKGEGYVLAAYLAPTDSQVFNNAESPSNFDVAFTRSDLNADGIIVGSSDRYDVQKKFGDPNGIVETDSYLLMRYEGRIICTISKLTSKLIRIEIIGQDIVGPRGMTVGLSVAEVLNSFPMTESSILSDSYTHDLILYSGEKEKLVAPYAVIRNTGMGGNGIIEFVNQDRTSNMEITITDGYATQLVIYINE